MATQHFGRVRSEAGHPSKPRWGKPPTRTRATRRGPGDRQDTSTRPGGQRPGLFADTVTHRLDRVSPRDMKRRGSPAETSRARNRNSLAMYCACALTDCDAKHDVRVLVEYRSAFITFGKSQAIELATARTHRASWGDQRKTKRLPCPPTHGLAVVDLPQYPTNFRAKCKIRGPLTPRLPVC